MRRQIPKLETMLAFEAAARRENFSKAAEDIHLTQGAISRQVIGLEDFLGCQLFIRARGRLKLSSAGRRLFTELTTMLDGLEGLILETRNAPLIDNELVVASYPTFTARFLVQLTIAYEAAFPDQKIRLITISSNAEFDPDRADIAILQGSPPWKQATADYLMPEDLVLVSSPEYRAQLVNTDIQSLSKVPMLRLVTRPMSFQIWSGTAGLPMKAGLTGPVFDKFDVMIEAAITGQGMGIVPKIMVERELKTGQLVQVHDHISRPDPAYYILIPESQKQNEKVISFKKWLINSVSELITRKN